MDGSEARVATMSEYDVQMASTGSANEAPGDYSKRMRDKKIMLAPTVGQVHLHTPFSVYLSSFSATRIH